MWRTAIKHDNVYHVVRQLLALPSYMDRHIAQSFQYIRRHSDAADVECCRYEQFVSQVLATKHQHHA